MVCELYLNKAITDLTAMAQLVGHHPAGRGVTSSIPGQGTCLDGPHLGRIQETIDVSLSH